MLLCIGVQITWNGVEALLKTLLKLEMAMSYRAAEFAGRYSFTRASNSSRRKGPPASRPESSGDFRLQSNGEFSSVLMKPPALVTRAAPPAMSQSCFGVSVKVISARPAETSASL